MKTIIYHSENTVFIFEGKDVLKILILKIADYDLEESAKLLKRILFESDQTIVIPEEPAFFEYIAIDLINAGHGSALCIICNKIYSAKELKLIQTGLEKTPLDIQRDKIDRLKRLFARKLKPPAIIGTKGFECPSGHQLFSIVTCKLF